MSEDRYQPSEEAVERLLARHTPRQLAIAYLRSQRRARQSDLAFRTLFGITEAEAAVRDGDEEKALDDLAATLRRLKGAEL